MITYNWVIVAKPTATVSGYENVVLAVIWELEAENDENQNKSSTVGTTFFQFNSSSFIPYENLTDEIVIGWIESKENIALIKTYLDSKIQ